MLNGDKNDLSRLSSYCEKLRLMWSLARWRRWKNSRVREDQVNKTTRLRTTNAVEVRILKNMKFEACKVARPTYSPDCKLSWTRICGVKIKFLRADWRSNRMSARYPRSFSVPSVRVRLHVYVVYWTETPCWQLTYPWLLESGLTNINNHLL